MKKYLFVISIIFSLSSCGIYSFSGASIDKETKTVFINEFVNKATTIQPILSQLFTEKMKDIFIQQTNLSLSDDEGDLSFYGYIDSYQIRPINIILVKILISQDPKMDLSNIRMI